MNDAAGEEGAGGSRSRDEMNDDLLKQLPGKVLTVLFSAAGFLGFVTVAGGVTVWFHFYTAQLPAVKAIEEMPRPQLLVNGAIPLILFGVLGLVAVAVCYAIDPGGRAREGIVNSLIVLFGAAATVVVLAAPVDPGDESALLELITLGNETALLGLITLGVAAAIVSTNRLKVPDTNLDRLENIHTERVEEAPYPFKKL